MESFIKGEKFSYESVKKDIITFVEAFIEMKKAGYLENKVKEKISDWIVTFEEPILHHFLEYYEIKTSCEDIDFCDEFCNNPSFRRQITRGMRNVIANFCIKNELLTKEEIKEKEGWDNLEVYEEILEKLS